MTQNYCMKCMRKLGDSPVCGRCGYDNSLPSNAEPYHIAPGTVLAGKYLIGNVIGEGGFGITYVGLNVTLSKRVAIKEFYPSGAANRADSDNVIITRGKESFFQKGVQRFLDEAKNVAAFGEEDGIVDIVDYFQANNTAYIVMEYLEGETLKQYIERRGLFPVNKIISLMIPLMRSLAVVHSQGVIHRDISPDNIMYHRLSKLKLMDFGSARYFTNEERQMSIVLKQGFAPEEQYRSNGVQGPHTDVYALCATIYTCITGMVPVNSVERLVNDTLKRPSELGAQIPKYQEDALMHGLAVHAKDRTPNIDTLISELTTEKRSADAIMADYAKTRAPLPLSDAEDEKMIRQQPTAEAPRPAAGRDTANIPDQSTSVPNSYSPSQFRNTNIPNSYSRGQYQNTDIPGSYNPNQYTQPNYQNSYNPNSYNPNSYNPNSYNPNQYGTNPNYPNSFPPSQPPKKSNAPKILAVVIPAVLVIAAVIIVVIALNSNGSGDSDKGFVSSQASSVSRNTSGETSQSSINIFDSSSPGPDSSSSQPSVNFSSGEKSSASSGSSGHDKGISLEEAKANGAALKDYFFENILSYDDEAEESQTVKSLGIYYVNKKTASFKLIYYVYQNVSGNYYRMVSAFPEDLYISNGKVVADSNAFDADDTGSTLDEAIKNSYFLDSENSQFYEVTQVY